MRNDLFCARARALIGESYNSTDCIGVVRKAAEIKCQGTNWLWRSYFNTPKYKYLSQRGEGCPEKLIPGQLFFRIRWNTIPDGYTTKPDCYHVGVLVWFEDEGWKIVQSNPKPGVYISDFVPDEWDAWGLLKQVEYTFIPDVPAPDPVLDDMETLIRETYNMVKVLYDAYMRGLD